LKAIKTCAKAFISQLAKNISNNNLDKRLFEQLFHEHFVHLCNFAQSFVYDLDEAKEIVQVVFTNLWLKKEEITTEKSIKSYLYTSVRNRCLNFIRDHKKFRSQLLDLDTAGFDMAYEVNPSGISELENKVEKAIDGLPEKCAEVFKLSRFEQMKYKEIGEKLNISIKTVEAQISKALKHLREELKEYIIILILFILKMF